MRHRKPERTAQELEHLLPFRLGTATLLKTLRMQETTLRTYLQQAERLDLWDKYQAQK